MQIGIIPTKEWYLAIPELKIYDSSIVLLKLAFKDLDAFQALDKKYPGFLMHIVNSYDYLNLFCQLLPDSYVYLLNAPQLQIYIPDALHLVRILQNISSISFTKRLEIIRGHIRTLQDLVAVVHAFPSYFCLIAEDCNSFIPVDHQLKEGAFAHLIQTRDDLMCFDLNSPLFLRIIKHVPRFRSLVGTSKSFYDDSIRSLDIPRPTPITNKTNLNSSGIFAEPSSTVAVLDSRLLTLGQAINLMQFQEGAGYYTNGNINFSTENQKGHFSTEASDGYTLAIALSYRAMHIWQQLPIEQRQCFEVLEAGAGEGDLCFKIIEFIGIMGETNSEWNQLYQALHYTIIEISAELVRRQQEKLVTYIQQGKVEVMQGDALDMKDYKRVATLHIINELMDMFPSEQIIKDRNNQTQMMMVLPILFPEVYEYLKEHNPQSIIGFTEEVNSFKQCLEKNAITVPTEGYPLTKERFIQLLAITANKTFTGPLDCFFFLKYTLDLSLFPKSEHYLEAHDEILTGMKPGDLKIISPALDSYAIQIKAKALVSIMIDYGDTTFKLNNMDYRSFGAQSALFENIFWVRPGRSDITYDVDFTALITTLKRSVPNGRTRLMRMGGLLPENITLPNKYKYRCTSADLDEFRGSRFFTALFIAPNLNIKLEDIEARETEVVTKEQLWHLISYRAQSILDLNEKEKVDAQRSVLSRSIN